MKGYLRFLSPVLTTSVLLFASCEQPQAQVSSTATHGGGEGVVGSMAIVQGLELALVVTLVLIGLLVLLRYLVRPGREGPLRPVVVFALCLAAALRGLAVKGALGLPANGSLLTGLVWPGAPGLGLFSYSLLFVALSLSLLPDARPTAQRIGVFVLTGLSVIATAAVVCLPTASHATIVVGAAGILTLGFVLLTVTTHLRPAEGGATESDRAGRVSPLLVAGSIVLALAAVNDLLVLSLARWIGYVAPLGVLAFAVLCLLDDARFAIATPVAPSDFALVPREFISDEIKRPLRGIVGLAESLLAGRMGDLEGEQVVSLSLIAASSLRLSNAVSNLVDHDRLDRGEITLDLTSVAIEPVVERVSEYLKPLMIVRSLEVRRVFPADLPPVLGDRSRIEQIIHNLMGQAIRRREHGIVAVTGRTVAKTVEITVTSEETLPEEDETRAPESSRNEGFSRLSMEVAEKLVVLHSGSLNDRSDGSKQRFEVSFSLPAAEEGVPTTAQESAEPLVLPDEIAMDEEQSASPASGSPMRNNYRVLVADGDLISLQTMRNLLVQANYRVLATVKGEEAVDRAQSYPPDLVLVDSRLPDVDGMEVCRRLRAKYPSTELPILILVNKDQVIDLVAGTTAGASDFISKPILADEFLARVRTHLNLAKMNTLYSRFVPVELLHFIGHDNVVDLQLGDQIQREMTILFVDIRAFTNLSEGMTPQENFKFINSYLARITPIIRENNGFIDKYIGDAILALYPGSPEDALRSAVRMIEYLQEYNGYRKNSGYRAINIGVGIHTGNLIVGIVGDSARMQGTVISDAVNLASRVQDVTKLYGANIIISQDTFVRLENPTAYNFRFLGRVKVKGKDQTVSLFEVFDGDLPERIALKNKTKQDFEEAILLFSQKKFAPASDAFREISRKNPDDRAAALFQNRSELFLKREKANWLLK